MDTEQAIDYLKKMHEGDASQTSTSAATEDTSNANGEQGSEAITTPATEPIANVEGETTRTNGAGDKVATEPQKKPSKQERINHAFQREKAKHKEQLAEKDKRIAELEEKIKKYSVLEQGDFSPNDVKSYIDHKFALQGEQSELESLKADRDRIITEQQQREANERHEMQVQKCFTSEEEQQKYWRLLSNGGAKFRDFLNTYDDGTIDKFVGDSDIAPKLIATLMRSPDVLRSIVEKRDPMRKMIALQQLENRLIIKQKLGVKQAQNSEQKVKTKLPIIGSQVKNQAVTEQSTKRDWNRYLAEHPFGH